MTDSKRLDWYVKHAKDADHILYCCVRSGKLQWYWPFFDGSRYYPTYREAIDAAVKEEKRRAKNGTDNGSER